MCGGRYSPRLTLSEVRLFDADTTLVAWLPEVNVSYNRSTSPPAGSCSSNSDLRRP